MAKGASAADVYSGVSSPWSFIVSTAIDVVTKKGPKAPNKRQSEALIDVGFTPSPIKGKRSAAAPWFNPAGEPISNREARAIARELLDNSDNAFVAPLPEVLLPPAPAPVPVPVLAPPPLPAPPAPLPSVDPYPALGGIAWRILGGVAAVLYPTPTADDDLGYGDEPDFIIPKDEPQPQPAPAPVVLPDPTVYPKPPDEFPELEPAPAPPPTPTKPPLEVPFGWPEPDWYNYPQPKDPGKPGPGPVPSEPITFPTDFPIQLPIPTPTPTDLPQPAPQPQPAPEPRPGDEPFPWFNPFPALPSPQPGARPGTRPGTRPTPANPQLPDFDWTRVPTGLTAPQPQPVPLQSGCPPCSCTESKPDRKQKKKRKPRKVCYRGTFTETSTSTRKVRKEKIPCQSSSVKSRLPQVRSTKTFSAARLSSLLVPTLW